MKKNELRHSIVLVEQAEMVDQDGKYDGTAELSIWEDSKFKYLPSKSFGTYLRCRYPNLDWEFDDGDDWNTDPDTTFCQYVWYTDSRRNHCVLATYVCDEM